MAQERLQPGEVFAGYVIERLLGAGGMGVVYLARHPNLPKRVALKFLTRALTDNDEVRTRFQREADHVARLEHPNIVAVFDKGDQDGQLWIAMQYVDGSDAAEAVRAGPLPPGRAVRIIAETAKALDFAHDAGILHRDVKPANILLARPARGQPERVLLTDFGIAKALDDPRGLTATGMFAASLQYAAPEQLDPSVILDGRADEYSLGCTLFHLLTGSLPYPGRTAPQLMYGHLHMPIPRPTDLPAARRAGVPPRIDAVIERALAKDRAHRYPSCGALAAAAQLATEATDTPTLWASMSRPAPPRIGIEGVPTWQQRSVSPADQTLPAQRSNPSPPAQHDYRQQYSPRRGTARRRTAAVLVTVAAIAALGVVAYVTWPKDRNTHASNTTTTAATSNTAARTRPRTQIQLPFVGLNGPHGVAVNDAGDLFITDSGNNRVLEMPAGSTAQGELPFTGLGNPVGIAVNTHGDLFVADWNNRRVLELPAGSSAQVVLPISGLDVPIELAVNPAGDLFVTDLANRVHMLPAGANSSTTLPFGGLAYPHGIGVNHGGDVFVADTNNNRVVKLPAGSNAQTELPFKGLAGPVGLTVSSHDDVYVTDYSGRRVLELPARSGTQTVLPLTGLTTPAGTAVNASGDVFVTDSTNNWVLKLPAE